jgi:hypothetical protein
MQHFTRATAKHGAFSDDLERLELLFDLYRQIRPTASADGARKLTGSTTPADAENTPYIGENAKTNTISRQILWLWLLVKSKKSVHFRSS